MIDRINAAHRSLASFFFNYARNKSRRARDHENAVERGGIHSQVPTERAHVAVRFRRNAITSSADSSPEFYGRGRGVGRGLAVGVGRGLGVEVGVAVAVGVGVGVPPPTKLNLPIRVCQSPFWAYWLICQKSMPLEGSTSVLV